MRKLSEAGVRVGVGIAPIIPGLNDRDIPELLMRAKESGAAFAFRTLLRLPGSVRAVFLRRLAEEYFESEIVKAAIASVAIHGSTLGPMSAGTGYTLIHNWMNRGGLSQINVGRAGDITQSLANAVKSLGGEIRTQTEVSKICV